MKCLLKKKLLAMNYSLSIALFQGGSIMSCISDLKSDLYRYSSNTTFKSFVKYYFSSEGFKFTVWLRVCHYLRKKKIYKYSIFPFAKLFYNRYRIKYGFDIPYSIEIGPGLLLFHINGIIISAKKIGKNATISHCTTIGISKPYFIRYLL